MPIKKKALQAIKTIACLYAIVFFAESCKNANNTSNKATAQHQAEPKVQSTVNKDEDSIVIGDVHILFNDSSNFLTRFRKDPNSFYYSDISKRDFCLLHDQTSQKYFLLGAENGGCLSCINYIEFINAGALTKEIIPEEIQDTMKFKPHRIEVIKYNILEYPYLELGSKENSIKQLLVKKGFKLIRSSNGQLLTNAGGGKLYQKVTDYTILSVIIKNSEIVRVSVQENVDVF